MKAYIICIALALLFTIVSDLFFKYKKNIFGVILLSLSLLLISLIAGLRSEYVGTDIRVYLKGLYNGFYNENLTLIMAIKKNGIEPMFALVVFLATKFGNINIVLFILSLICALPIYYYSYIQKEKIPCTFNVFIYLSALGLSRGMWGL